ncbi:MAG TPA: hypothetical protein PLE99_15855 [Candidatus Thiothrix moscowensis]|uniref:hypothetical protein n=1 Tax=unclassified Thiothrix TaxID=2636184 RepID=UPI002600067C|nr:MULTISPECIES: hypothetical protein [unclassified Thiothrix]HRJ54234.1 hypothetical protein [Candidatus Thiothrix moscowensis]HRJ94500.1 hypothetical protein [Candidatus Thiothrix moscowensis]
MAISTVVEQKRTRIATVLSTKPLLMGMSAVDIGWFFHLLAAMWMGYFAFHGENPLEFTGLNAPPYKIGVVAIAEGARAILSMANVWEEEINWVASTVLVLVLMTAGGADVNRIPQAVPGFQYNSNMAVVSNKQYDMSQCSFYSGVLGRQLTQQEKNECIQMNNNGSLDSKWAKNCGCS